MDRIIDITVDGRHLSTHRGFLVVADKAEEVGRVPLDDIAAVIVHAHGTTWSTNLMIKLAERGATAVLCGSNHAPKAMLTPLDGHHAQNARMRAQWEASKPLGKRLWQQIIRRKIELQACVAASTGQETEGLMLMARRVQSGDPDNLEAQAARRYWPLMMGKEFRRDRQKPGINGLLNYGYTVLRALTSRAIVASGLHPSIGIHHGNRTNSMALADDLMEPYRPLVDYVARRLFKEGVTSVSPVAKAAFSRLIAVDYPGERGTSTLGMNVTRLAQSLATAFEQKSASALILPVIPSDLELTAFDAVMRDP